jgi:hypothetical protein
MVVGDLVNTASRIQSVADPGQVLVGEATRRATEAAIAFRKRRRARAERQVGRRCTRASLSRHRGRQRRAAVGRSQASLRRGGSADPRSPERGQYGFLQDLVRRVAYDKLSRRDRKSRHLAAAELSRASFGESEQEIVEVVASHYLAAYDAQRDADDATEIKTSARELLARAGERIGSLAARIEARRYFERAAELADEPLERARLLERAGEMALSNTQYEVAERAFSGCRTARARRRC